MDSLEFSQPKKELTVEERKIAKSFEESPSLELRDKIFLVLIWRGLKTASPVSIDIEKDKSAVETLMEKVSNAGLFSLLGNATTQEKFGLKSGRILFVANNEKDLKLVFDLWNGDHQKDPQVYKEIGRMSGFPQTAIDTYDAFTRLLEPEREAMKEKLVLSEEEKKKLIPAEFFPFASLFFMSRAHWQAEFETMKKCAGEIKFVTPQLYQQYLDWYSTI